MTPADTVPPAGRRPTVLIRLVAVAGAVAVTTLASLAGAGPAAAAPPARTGSPGVAGLAGIGGLAGVAGLPGLPGLAPVALAPVALAPVTPSSANGRRTFGVQPASRTGPDTRSRLTYSATPGAALTDYVSVSNVSSAPLTVQLYASDAFNTGDGGFDLLPRTRTPVDVGSWVSVAQRAVTLKPRSQTVVRFRLSVPRNATPGDHAGGVVASLTTVGRDAKGNRITLDQRVGVRIYLRVSGPLQPRLQVIALSSTYRNTPSPAGCGTVDVKYTVRNTGNVRLGGRQVLRVRGLFGLSQTERALPNLPELLPGNAVSTTGSVSCVRPAVRITTTLGIQPLPAPGDLDPAAAPASAHRGLWALPWVLLGLAVVVLAGVGWMILRRRRRGPTTPQPVAPPAPGPGGPPAAADPNASTTDPAPVAAVTSGQGG